VYQLEGLRGAALRSRLKQIRGPYRYTSLIVTQLFAIVELAFLLSGWALFVWFAPGPDVVDWNSLGTRAVVSQSVLFGNILYALIVCTVEPMYVAAGFAMYLNRRVELEAWDIEQEFRSAFAT
jgi:hypothetical protein